LPTYEYHCDTCDQNFDVVQSFDDEPLTACPTCGSPVRKVFGNVGIVFKGSGFYKTDSRSGGPAKSAGGENPPPTSGPDGNAADTTTAPATEKNATEKPSGGDTPAAPKPSPTPSSSSSPAPKKSAD
jgi:putative FmdB family regulatory protein